MNEEELKILLGILGSDPEPKSSNHNDYDDGYADGYSDGVVEASRIVKDFFDRCQLAKLDSYEH